MTQFHDRNQRREHAWVTPGDDDLDDFLNTNAASTRAPGAGNDDLASTASAFHRRFVEAQERDPAFSQPDPDLWNRILADAGSQGKAGPMSSAPHALNTGSTITGSLSPSQAMPSPRHSRLGRWANAFAAVSLVLLIAVGVWFSGYGPGGGSGNHNNLRYAAQVVSPMASPEVSSVGCTVEPLTTDEVMAIVRNPLNRLDEMGVELEASPEPFLETRWNAPHEVAGPEMGVAVPEEQEFESIRQAANEYYACLQFGTNYQIWALRSPYAVQSQILSHFPVMRDEDAIQEWIEQIGVEPYAASLEGVDIYEGFNERGYRIQPNPDRSDALITEEGWEPRTAWIGTQLLREDNNEVVGKTDVRKNIVAGDDQSPGIRPPEILVLATWGDTGVWLVQGSLSLIG